MRSADRLTKGFMRTPLPATVELGPFMLGTWESIKAPEGIDAVLLTL